MKTIVLIIIAVCLSGCITLDKDRASEQRKQDLCNDIDTRDLPQCSGEYVPPTPHT